MVQVTGAEFPERRKLMLAPGVLSAVGAAAMRDLLGGGSLGGPYSMVEDMMEELWVATGADVREVLNHGRVVNAGSGTRNFSSTPDNGALNF